MSIRIRFGGVAAAAEAEAAKTNVAAAVAEIFGIFMLDGVCRPKHRNSVVSGSSDGQILFPCSVRGGQ